VKIEEQVRQKSGNPAKGFVINRLQIASKNKTSLSIVLVDISIDDSSGARFLDTRIDFVQ
jgi:hypothetical protein